MIEIYGLGVVLGAVVDACISIGNEAKDNRAEKECPNLWLKDALTVRKAMDKVSS